MRYSIMAGVALAAMLFASPATTGGMIPPKPAVPVQTHVQPAYFLERNITRSGLQNTHYVALTFDDGPNGNTRDVLATLRAHNIKATFFVVGDMARNHAAILREIVADGHLLANHTASHPRLGGHFVSHPKALIRQIREVDDIIAPLMKAGEPLFFRAPYGYWRKAHAAALNADPILKYYVGPIYWDEGGDTTVVDGDGYVQSAADWDCWPRGWSAETCAKGYIREITRKDGGVVLMHCIHSKSGALVEAVVPALIEKGFKFVRLDEVPGYDRYKGPPPDLRPAIAMSGGPYPVGAR